MLWRVPIRCDLRFRGCVLAARGDEREKIAGLRAYRHFSCESVNTDTNTFGIQGMIKEGKMIRKQKRK